MSSAINCALAIILLIGVLNVSLIVGQNEIVEHDYSRDPDSVYPNQQIGSSGHGGSTWFNTVRNAIAQPAGQMVMHMAKEMISRSAGNSQVRIAYCLSLAFLSVASNKFQKIIKIPFPLNRFLALI